MRIAGISASPPHAAVAGGSQQDIDALLNEGAPIEIGATITLSNGRSLQGITLLHVAVFNRETAVIELLLDRGVDINAMTTTGETPCDLERHLDRLAGTAVIDRLCAS